MNITTSVNVSVFDFKACGDISVPTPVLNLTDISTFIGAGATNIIGINFKIISPTNIAFHDSIYPPDIDLYPGLTTYSINLPYFSGQVIWGDYKVYATLIDQDGTQIQWADTDGTLFKTIPVCKPNTLLNASGNYGGLNLIADFDCELGRLLVTEQMSYSYKGKVPTTTVTNIVITYPADSTGTVVTSVADFIPFSLPITTSGTYTIQGQVTQTYFITDTVCVVAGYKFYDTFDVNCGFTLCKALCEYEKLLEEVNNCGNLTPAQTNVKTRQLLLITGLLAKVNFFKNCGKKFGDVLEQIRRIGNFDCNCDCAPEGITPSPVFFAGTLVKGNMCGDIDAVFTQFGNNVRVDLSDMHYVIDFIGLFGDSVTINPVYDAATCTTTYQITVDLCAALDEVSITCLGDVSDVAPTNGQVLIWDSVSGLYVPGNLSTGIILENFTVAAPNVTNALETIRTYILPAATFLTDKSQIIVETWFSAVLPNTFLIGTYLVDFNGVTTLNLNTVFPINNFERIKLETVISRESNTTASVKSEIFFYDVAGNMNAQYVTIEPTTAYLAGLNWTTTPYTIRARVTEAVANISKNDYFTVKIFRK